MKKYWLMFKQRIPFFKKKILDAIPVILIYQSLLFLLSPTKINQVILVIFIVFFTLSQFAAK